MSADREFGAWVPPAIGANATAEIVEKGAALWKRIVNRLVNTAGTSTAYTAEASPTMGADDLSVNTVIIFTPHVDSGLTPTLAIDGIAAEALLDADGNAPAVAFFKAGRGYPMVRQTLGSGYRLIGMNAAANSATNATLADMAQGTVKMRRAGAGTGDPTDTTLADLKTDLALVKGDVGLANADNTSDANKPVSTAQAAALALKANLASAAFSGAVSGSSLTANAGTVIVDRSGDAAHAFMEIRTDASWAAHLQLRTGASLRWQFGKYHDVESGANAGSSLRLYAYDDVGATIGSYVWNIERATKIVTYGVSPLVPTPSAGDNTTKVASTAFVQSEIAADVAVEAAARTAADALLAPIASPTFTGTVGGITKTMVGLGNVDNTSDVNKPVSTAQAAAIAVEAADRAGADADILDGTTAFSNTKTPLLEYVNSVTALEDLRRAALPGSTREETSSGAVQSYLGPDGKAIVKKSLLGIREDQRDGYIDPREVYNPLGLQLSNVRAHPRGGIVALVSDRHGAVDCYQEPREINPRGTFVVIPWNGKGIILLMTGQSWVLTSPGGLPWDQRAIYPTGVLESSAEASSYSNVSVLAYPQSLESELLSDWPPQFFDHFVHARSTPAGGSDANSLSMLAANALYSMWRYQGRGVMPIYCWSAAQGATSLADMDGSDMTAGARSRINYTNAIRGVRNGARFFARLGIYPECPVILHMQGAQGASESSPGVPDYTGWPARMEDYADKIRAEIADVVHEEAIAAGLTDAVRRKPVVIINQVPVSQTASAGTYEPLRSEQTTLPDTLSDSTEITAIANQTVFDTSFNIPEADDLHAFIRRNGDSHFRPLVPDDDYTVTPVISFPGLARVTFARGLQVNEKVRLHYPRLISAGPAYHALLPIADSETGALDDNIHHSNVGRMAEAQTDARVVDLVAFRGVHFIPLRPKVGGAVHISATQITVEFECSLFDTTLGIDNRIEIDADWIPTIASKGFRYTHSGGDAAISSVDYYYPGGPGTLRSRNKLLVTLSADPGAVTNRKLRIAMDNLTEINGAQALRSPVMIEERGIKAVYSEDAFAYLNLDGTRKSLPQWVRHYSVGKEVDVTP